MRPLGRHPDDGDPGGVLAGLIEARTAESVLRVAFAEAHRLAKPVRVVIAGSAADASLADLIERWAEKCPAVPVTTTVRRGLDAAVVLSAATHHCDLAVVSPPGGAGQTALLQAVTVRAHCPLVTVPRESLTPEEEDLP